LISAARDRNDQAGPGGRRLTLGGDNKMGQKILVALDESENAFRAVEFVARTFTPEHAVTLLSVYLDAEGLCKSQGPQMSPYFTSYKTLFCSVEEKKKELMAESQQKAKEILLRAGFPEKQITTKLLKLNRGVARDIVEEADAGYQVVVMGRRGLSSVSEFILGSVSQKVIHSCKDATMVIVS
jgi:nucleotide-binding universal stress UspA family protein